MVPIEPIMRRVKAPNQRMESIAKNLKDASDKSHYATEDTPMFELMSHLGLSKPDPDGSSFFKKDKLVPEPLLRAYMEAAFRLKYLLATKQRFSDY